VEEGWLARIPEEELARLKAEVSLVGLVEAKGVVLSRHGADLVGLCPFHEDREPSLVVSPGKNLWHCLGACQAGGSVVDWVMRAEGVSFRHAVELLRADMPVSGRAGPPPARTTRNLLPAELPLETWRLPLCCRLVGPGRLVVDG
jgi:DNA primase